VFKYCAILIISALHVATICNQTLLLLLSVLHITYLCQVSVDGLYVLLFLLILILLFVRVIKSRRLRWSGLVARMGGRERCVQGSGGET
jgi:hypothetical protein